MIDPALEGQLHQLLAEARPGSIPGNVLVWWGPSDFPDGKHSVPTLSQAGWEARYLQLTSGVVAPDALPRLSQLELGVRRARPDAALPIAVVDVELAVPEPKLVSEVVAAANAGTKLAAPPRSLTAATTPARAFLAAGLLHQQWGRSEPAYRGFDVSYVVDPQLFVTDRGRPPPSHLDIDAGDGRGFRTVRFGEPFEASYPPKAKPVVTVRVEDGRRAMFTVTLSDVPAAPAPDEVWDLAAAGDKPNTGCAYVHRAPGHADVTAPVIVAEGFPGAYAPDYLYDLVDQHGLLKRLLAAGRDVLLLSFENGADRIERNAGVVTACVREARRRTAQPLAVGGVSMGGLVARYALTEMEHRGEDHQTALFFTVDTPHRGAYTSVGAQWFAHAFQRSSSFLAGYAALLDAPANQQFVQRWVHDGAAIESPLRRDLLRDLARLGDYPRRPRRIAVSCGRGDGARSIPPATPTMSWSGSPFVDARLTTMPEHGRATIGRAYWFADAALAGSDLTVDGDWSWEGAPGGQDTYAGVVARAAAGVKCGKVEHHFDSSCSLPTVSALGLDQGPFVPIPPSGSGSSPFDAYTCSDDNQQHLVLEPRVADWLANELAGAGAARRSSLGPEAPNGPHSRRGNGTMPDHDFNPHDPTFLADPYPTYARLREESPVRLVQPYDSYWVFGYDDAVAVLTDTDTYVKNPPAGPTPTLGPGRTLDYFPDGLFGSDPPRHTELRTILQPLFDAAIEDAPAVATKVAAGILDHAKITGYLELVAEYAIPVPSTTLFTMLGLPQNQPTDYVWPGLVNWVTQIAAAHDITQSPVVRGAGGTCAMALDTFFEGLVTNFKQFNTTGLVASMVHTVDTTGGLTPVDVQVSASDFTVAGYLSTTFLIGTGVRHLIESPAQAALLREQPDLIHDAVEEMLRIDPPAQIVDRVTAFDTELRGVPLPAGTKVSVNLGSANHDPARFAEPDTFLITRDNETMIAFGDGIHICIGAPLVRVVAPVAIGAIAALPDLQLDGIVQWQTDPYLRAVTSLPIRFG